MNMKTAILCLAATLLPLSASAASFDCKRATTQQEKLICANPEISKQDEDLAALYARQLARLSDAGQDGLRASQRSWLVFRNRACGGDVECLAAQYDERLEFMGRAVLTRGAYVFVVLDKWRFIAPAKPDGDSYGDGAMQYQQRLHLRIDAPRTETTEDFNGALARIWPVVESGFDGAQRDYAHFNLNEATDDLVSVDNFGWIYPVGAAHGVGAAEHLNYLLKERRLVSVGDIFLPDSGWQPALADLVLADLAAQARADDQPLFDEGREGVATMSPDPTYWVVTSEGLGVNFPVYSVGPYSFGDRTVTIPWERLKPFLAPESPLPFW